MQLRRERGLSTTGDYRLPLVALNRLILQSGLTLGIGTFAIYLVVLALFAVRPGDVRRARTCWKRCRRRAVLLHVAAVPGAEVQAQPAAEEIRRAIPRRARHHRAQPARRPSGADRHHHGGARDAPIRSAASSASSPTRSPMAPISKPRMRNLYFRIGQDDLPLFVTAVAIQGSTGGNLGEILENLSARHPPALQDAAQDPRARLRRPRLGDDPVVAADRDVSASSSSSRRISMPASGTRT